MRSKLSRRLRTVDDSAPLPLPRMPGEGYTQVVLTLVAGEYTLSRRPDGMVDLVEIRAVLRRADDPLPIWAMATAVPTGDRRHKGPPTPEEMNAANRRFWEVPK